MFWVTVGKTVTTLFMWLMLSAIAIISIDTPGGDSAWVAIVAMIAAVVGTFFIWVASELIKQEAAEKSQQQAQSYEKAKRGSGSAGDKLALLLEMMDYDEREAFKETLKRRVLDDASVGNDGEINYEGVSLGALLDDQSRQSRR